MKSTKGILPIVVAFVIALAGSILTYAWMTKQGSSQTVVKVDADAVKIAVAINDLPWGTKLKKEHITFSPFLKESLPQLFHGPCFTGGAYSDRTAYAKRTHHRITAGTHERYYRWYFCCTATRQTCTGREGR